MNWTRQMLAGLIAGVALATGAQAQDATETTLNDQTEVAVTAYNNNVALVRDVRKLKLPKGETLLRFSGVAEQVRPETVSLRSLSGPGSLSILEQNYEYDLISPQKLMEKFVGQQVKLINLNKEFEFVEKDAKLLSVNEGPVYEVEGKIYLGHPGNVVLPEIPKNLAAKPSLVWTVQNDAEEQQVEASYLTGGLSWHADYVLTIPKDESKIDVAGWVTMDNQSGATYNNATLKLVAGEVNMAPAPAPMAEMAQDRFFAKAAGAAAMPVQEAFGEYHLYTIPRKTTIKQNQSKQVALMDASGVKFKKTLEFRGDANWYNMQMQEQKDLHADVQIEFANKEANAMGMPLPAGVMRLYQEDGSGAMQFLGEDRIQHTPKDETVRLKVGKAFDVVGDRKQLDYQAVSDRVHEAEFEVTLRNHKATDVTVDLIEPMAADWEVLKHSHEFVKRDAMTLAFSVPVKADGEVKVTYRVRVRY